MLFFAGYIANDYMSRYDQRDGSGVADRSHDFGHMDPIMDRQSTDWSPF
jgi:hypothetical protein